MALFGIHKCTSTSTYVCTVLHKAFMLEIDCDARVKTYPNSEYYHIPAKICCVTTTQ